MHAVPPPMIRNYMPTKSDYGIDETKFTYGPKQSTTSESDAKTSDLHSCESSSSEETLENMPKPVESKPKVVNEPKVGGLVLLSFMTSNTGMVILKNLGRAAAIQDSESLDSGRLAFWEE
nr:hypothetical protein [Tanacetum cinerariifolium]